MRLSDRLRCCQEEAPNYGSLSGITQLTFREASDVRMYTPAFERNISFDAFTISDAGVLLACAVAGFGIFFLLYQSAMLAAGALIIGGGVSLMFRWPEIGKAVALFAIYFNVCVLALRSQRSLH